MSVVRLLLDEQLSERLLSMIASAFAGSVHCRQVGLGGASDARIWQMASDLGCVLVTKDEDFVDLSALRGAPPKVVWLRVGNASTEDTARCLLEHATAIAAFVEDDDATVLMVRPRP